MESSSTEVSPLRGTVPSQPVVGRVVANSCPILAASPQTTQQPIISMEDDEISDQEIVSCTSCDLFFMIICNSYFFDAV